MRKTISFTFILMFGILISNQARPCGPSCPPCYGGVGCFNYLCNSCQYCGGGCVYAGVGSIITDAENNWCVGELDTIYVTTSPAGFYYCVAASCGSHCIGCCGWWITYFETAGPQTITACTSAGCKTKNIMIVGVESVTADKTSCCADDPEGILFTATSKPAGQTMRCIYWQYRFRANPNVQWDDTYWGTLTDSYGQTQYRLTGIWGAGYYQMRAINGDVDYTDAYAVSPIVEMPPCEFYCNGGCCDMTNCEICKNGTCVRAVPTNMHQTAVVDMGYGILRFEYRWESTSGDLNDLINCTVGEKVDYPEGSPFYYWPYPPWTESNPNPTISDRPAYTGREIDTHQHGYLSSPYQNAGFAANQIYRYHCGPSCCMEEGEYETLLEIGQILRFVTGEGDLWRYSIIKSGAYAEYFPLP